MWSREELKERAKSVLRKQNHKYYWIAFLVTLVASILGGSAGMPSFNFNFGSRNFSQYNGGFQNWDFFRNSNVNYPALFAGLLFGIAVVSSIFIIALIIGFAFKIFVGGPIETGMKKYFLEARQDKSDFVNLFYSFKGGRYMNVVKAIAWRELFTCLWALLFLVPGIIKGFSYSMIPYLMADNPNMDYQRAMKLSMAMTDGQKGDMFVLWLSFAGWYFLGVLACCIGVMFLKPYWYSTAAELYVTLRQKAIETGLCTAEEVGQQPAIAPAAM